MSGEVHVVWLTGGGETSFRPLVALLTEPMTQTGEGIYTGFDAMAAADTVTGLDIQYEIDNYEINNVRDGTYWPVAFIDFDQNGVITDRDVFASYNNQSDSIVVDGEDVEDVDFHLTGGSSESVQPAGLQLHHPRPHPASGSAVIPFELEKGSEVSLRIYDMLGREVRTLLDGVFLPTGRHEVSWAAGIHPNGAYVCRLTAGQAQVSLTIIVAR